MSLSWFGIVRLGLVQMALGAIVVLTTSTLNRLMVVELSLPAVLPGLLVGLHYGIQITRPNWGFLSDKGGNRTLWILGGMATLAVGGILAALGVVWLETHWLSGLLLSIFAYALIGLGVGASGTSVLALLATTTAPRRRAAAATTTWLMMIFGIAVTASVVGQFLDPYSPERLMAVVSVVAALAFALSVATTWGLERKLTMQTPDTTPTRFRDGLAEVWSEPAARYFTIFVFLSMTAYFMQELILEPYAGLVFGLSPGESTMLSGTQNQGVFLGMLCIGIAATGFKLGSMRAWVFGGCLSSAACLCWIAALPGLGGPQMLTLAVFSLGFSNGVFAVAAIASMMALAGEGRQKREGTRMGLWGAAQAIAAGFGGLTGAAAADILRISLPDETAFGVVFTIEAALFIGAAIMALHVIEARPKTTDLVPGE